MDKLGATGGKIKSGQALTFGHLAPEAMAATNPNFSAKADCPGEASNAAINRQSGCDRERCRSMCCARSLVGIVSPGLQSAATHLHTRVLDVACDGN
ncbi:MAG: hypothetical protein E6R09_11295 [Rhodocyclaceae bacterium]|nr:MAG: hypothetical protein E6R09_11295 [Rhodocyclaceae bacterium]